MNISIRAWSSKIKVRTNIFHYLSWLITLDLLNTCIRTFGLWKICQILFESWNIIMFLYPKLLFVLKILKRVLIKIWYSICYKHVCLSKHINLQNSYSLPLNIQPNIVNLFRYFKRKNHRQNFCVLCVCQSIRIDLHHFWWIIPPKKKSGEKERICYYVWNSHYSISILLGCDFATLVWHFSSSFF